MPIHLLKLIKQQPIAENATEFHSEKPLGFTYTPGQYGGFTLTHPQMDPGGITRRFSLLSHPEEAVIKIATRYQPSAYKRTLFAMHAGDTIKFAGPTGNFILHADNHVPAVLLAGGIGIAPFYSMICHTLNVGLHREIYLFYGNQTLESSAYHHALSSLATKYPHFHYIPTLETPPTNWQGQAGYITHTMIRAHIKDINVPIYYVCGSPVMVTTIQELLAEMGIDEERIKVEDFPGY